MRWLQWRPGSPCAFSKASALLAYPRRPLLRGGLVTQLYDDVNDMGDGRHGRLRPVPSPAPDDEPWAPGDPDGPEPWDSAGASPDPAGGEPLFEQLRSAYLHQDDTGDWARDGDSGEWANDSG